MSSIFAGIPGWFIPIVILIVSILSLTIILERSWILIKKIKPINKKSEEKLLSYIKSRKYEDASSFCRLQSHPAYEVALAILEGRNNAGKSLANIVEESTLVQIKKLERHLSNLGTISTIAPLLGLLGTVTGMIKAFRAFEQVISRNQQLFSGIDEALITTALGLVVAIPSLIMYNFFVRKLDLIIKEMELFSEMMLRILNK